MNPKSKLIIALDKLKKDEIVLTISALKDKTTCFKIGQGLFIRHGKYIISLIKDYGVEIFLDLKLYDIPSSTADSIIAAGELGIDYLTIHYRNFDTISSILNSYNGKTKILTVTKLTSEVVAPLPVATMALEAEKAGVDGCICSAGEASMVKSFRVSDNFLIFTPGIRMKGAPRDDQVRVWSPYDAIKKGSDRLIVGRPITKADNPAVTADYFLSEIDRAINDTLREGKGK